MKAAAERLWESAQAHLRSILHPDTYERWFAPIRAVGLDDTTFTLEVADRRFEEWLHNEHATLLNEAVAKVAGRPLAVRFQVAAGVASELRPLLNPRSTFGTFVVGNNQFAHASALAVAQAPGKACNPLLLYGRVGLGKTHLLHAIGLHVATHMPSARVRQLTIEQFGNELVAAVKSDTVTQLGQKHQKCDLLLVDDVQNLAGKGRVQKEFLRLVEALLATGKQVVLTSDRPAEEIPGLDPALIVHFERGLVTDLQPPDYVTRLEILRRRSVSLGVALPDEIAVFMAKRIRANVRRLEGALIRVVSHAALVGEPISAVMAEAILRDVVLDDLHLADDPRRTSGQDGASSAFGLN